MLNRSAKQSSRGFTLIELLVVISIIALLISILLPSLKNARAQAKAVKCGANLAGVGRAIAGYTSESNGTFPTSYVYPSDPQGGFDIYNQPVNRPYGYLHWSYFLYSGGQVRDDVFQCPSMQHGGAPRTNPGPDKRNWEPGQVDDGGATGPNAREDKQAARMAYTANAAIMPRNKFTSQLVSAESSGTRKNTYVQDTIVRRPGATIAVTEFLNNWKLIGLGSGGNILSKSHRPISPFYNLTSQYDPFPHDERLGQFFYGDPQNPTFGLRTLRDLRDGGAWGEAGYNRANFVGRHHPGGDQTWGGTANFLYVDSHVERKTVFQTLKKREWGNRYFSVTGKNDVVMHGPVYKQTSAAFWP